MNLVPVRLRSGLALAAVFAVGIAAFGWPFLIEPGAALDSSHSGDAPFVFVALVPLLAAVVLAELTSGGMDAKAVAMLGMLAAVGGALRALGPGTAGLEPTFVVIVLGGRVFGRGFGFVLGAVTLFVGALVTGGVGPWLPFQMLGLAWMTGGAGLLGRVTATLRPRVEVLTVAAYGWCWGFLYGAIMNLWFWPFERDQGPLSWRPGMGLGTTLHHYWSFYVATSLGWDAAGALVNAALIVMLGVPLLRTLRRFAHRLEPVVELEPRHDTRGATQAA